LVIFLDEGEVSSVVCDLWKVDYSAPVDVALLQQKYSFFQIEHGYPKTTLFGVLRDDG
jgi:hypothetical protein